jgi:hypothetical protein
MNGYRHVAAVESQFRAGRLFAGEAEARAYDRGFATEALRTADFEAALRAGAERDERPLIAMLRFMAEEIERARWMKEADAEADA